MSAFEELNFLLSNRIPRRLATRLMGWFSHIESRALARLSIALWRRFSDLDLQDAQSERYPSLHACFTRELKPGARPVAHDPRLLASPCDGIIVAAGEIRGESLIQAKGLAYTLSELLRDAALAEAYRDGRYVTLRLTPSMYHRFHAPYDLTVTQVSYIAGDTWNVNPPALKRIARLYCRNERAVLQTSLAGSGHRITLVPVAAILVAGIKLRFLDLLLYEAYGGATHIRCAARLGKGEEMGWFEHGSTIILLAPQGFALAAGARIGSRIRMGEPLLQLP